MTLASHERRFFADGSLAHGVRGSTTTVARLRNAAPKDRGSGLAFCHFHQSDDRGLMAVLFPNKKYSTQSA